jgi:anti-sigma B factor antagonist
MKIDIERPQDRKIVVIPHGRVDVQTAPTLKEKLRELVDVDGLTIIVDLQNVDFIDSSGLSALVSGLKTLSQPQPQARTALRLTLLDRVFSIFPTLDQAIDEGELQDT